MSDVKPEGTTDGAPKRRRRRRSRRPSGQGQQSAQNSQQGGTRTDSAVTDTGTKNTPAKSGGTGGSTGRNTDKGDKGTEDNRSPSRRRRRRGRGRGGNTGATGHSTDDTGVGTAPGTDTAGGGSTRTLKRGGQQTAEPEGTAETTRGGRRKASGKGRGTQRRRTAARSGQRVQQAGQQSRMLTSDETSAGGLVVSGLAESVDEHGEVDLARVYVALIGRLDRRGRLLWSMPKGHVEPGEAKASTAEREVWEETGIHGEVFTELGVIDYWFVSEGRRIHKTVHHHLLRFVDGDLNDEDPEVTEVAWIPANQLIEHLAFADERKLARRAHDLLPDFARKEKAEGRATPR